MGERTMYMLQSLPYGLYMTLPRGPWRALGGKLVHRRSVSNKDTERIFSASCASARAREYCREAFAAST